MELKNFLGGFLVCAFLVGCAGATFVYREYGLDSVRYDQGKLLGPTPADDLPFSSCEPQTIDGKKKFVCVVMFADEFYRLKQDYLDTQNKLEHCQKQVNQ